MSSFSQVMSAFREPSQDQAGAELFLSASARTARFDNEPNLNPATPDYGLEF